MSSPAPHIISNTLYALNRLYAYWSFLVNYALYTSLWLLGGIPPNVDARVDVGKGWRPAVFVAMADGDVGRETVGLLAEKGYTVFAAVRSEEEGVALMKGLSTGSVHPIVCDFSERSINKAVDEIRRFGDANPGRRLVGVVINVGTCHVSPLESMTDQEINVRPLSSFLASSFARSSASLTLLAGNNISQPHNTNHPHPRLHPTPHIDAGAKTNHPPLLIRRVRPAPRPFPLLDARCRHG
jgi:hypothetical protein